MVGLETQLASQRQMHLNTLEDMSRRLGDELHASECDILQYLRRDEGLSHLVEEHNTSVGIVAMPCSQYQVGR